MKKRNINSLRYPPLYSKALEILSLSRHMSYLYQDDLSGLQSNGQEHAEIYFTGDIIQQSFSLGPEILKAEEQTYSEDKMHYVARLKNLTKKLFYTCERLEHSSIQGKEFLPLFRKELKQFKKLQRTWTLML